MKYVIELPDEVARRLAAYAEAQRQSPEDAISGLVSRDLKVPDEFFVDTSGWLCYLDAAQPESHQVIPLIQESLGRRDRLITSNYVLSESVALMSVRTRLSRPSVMQTLKTLR